MSTPRLSCAELDQAHSSKYESYLSGVEANPDISGIGVSQIFQKKLEL